jgi:hypothetical protein
MPLVAMEIKDVHKYMLLHILTKHLKNENIYCCAQTLKAKQN